MHYYLCKCSKHIYRPQTKFWGKVMFSQACVSRSVHRGEVSVSGSRGGGGASLSKGVSASGSGECAYPPDTFPDTQTWTPPGDTHTPTDTPSMVNKRAVRILLECLFV